MGWTYQDAQRDYAEGNADSTERRRAAEERFGGNERPMDDDEWREYWAAFSPWDRIAQVVRWAAEAKIDRR